jgi:MacB-like periplasmic core domain
MKRLTDNRSDFTSETTALGPANAAAAAIVYLISPGYFRAAGTALLSGRAFTWHDDKNAPRVAVINREFARRVFGSTTKAIGRYYKLRDGTRVQVVGIVKTGNTVTSPSVHSQRRSSQFSNRHRARPR